MPPVCRLPRVASEKAAKDGDDSEAAKQIAPEGAKILSLDQFRKK